MARLQCRGVTLDYPLLTRTAGGSQDRGEVTGSAIRRDTRGRPVGVRALNGIDLEVNEGDRLAVIGRNGSGKTTLLRVVSGLLPPDEGVVEIEGRLTSLININLGIQAQASGHQNITLRGLAAGMSRPEIEARRPEIAAFSELGEFLDLPVESYSSGMRMRLSFAIATAFEPQILVLDEWISTGDRSFRAKAAARMVDFVDRAPILVLASHSIPLIEKVCTRAIWLADGRLRMDGDVNAVLEAYKDAS